jgi:Flp pilus assembly protein TadG
MIAKTRKEKRRGNAVIEFAIGSSAFILLFSGTFQFGYTLYQYNNLETAVRAGARYASMIPYPLAGATADSAPASSYTTAVQNMTAYGNASAAPGAQPIVPSLDPSSISVNVTFANLAPAFVTVSVRSFTINSVFGSYTLTGKPVATFTYAGHFSPP